MIARTKISQVNISNDVDSIYYGVIETSFIDKALSTKARNL